MAASPSPDRPPGTPGGGEPDGPLPQPHRALPQLFNRFDLGSATAALVLGLLWISAALVGLGKLGWLSVLGLGLAVIAWVIVRRLERWELGLTLGDGHAPRTH